MNVTLRTKWWWKLLSGQCFLWGPLIRKNYYIRRTPLRERASFTVFSQWWKSVLGTKEVFKCVDHYVLGDGREVELWRDK